MRWTIDGSAINRIAAESTNFNVVFAALTQLIEGGDLSFCDEVVEELERTAQNEPGALWATAVKGQRQHNGAGMATKRWVIHNVANIVDPDARNDAMPHVLAQARSLHQDGYQIAVVTEDILDKPTRRALADACDELSIAWLQVPAWIAACGIVWP